MVRCFFVLCPISIFQFFADTINKLVISRQQKEKVVTVTEVIQYTAMRFQMIAQGLKRDIRDYFQKCGGKTPNPYKKIWWLSRNRFMFLHAHLKVNIKSLARMMSEFASKAFKTSEIVAIDESIFAYQGYSPVLRYIPRKPHPFGHLIYFLTSKTRKYNNPVIHCILTVSTRERRSMRSIINFFANWVKKKEVHVVHFIFDSAFMFMKVVNDLLMKGIYCTGSSKSTVGRKIWPVVSKNIDKLDTGRSFLSEKTSNNVIYTYFNEIEDGKLKTFRSISTSFMVSKQQPTANIIESSSSCDIISLVRVYQQMENDVVEKMNANLIEQSEVFTQLQQINSQRKKALTSLKKNIRSREVEVLEVVKIVSHRDEKNGNVKVRLYKTEWSDGSVVDEPACTFLVENMPLISFIRYAVEEDYKIYTDALSRDDIAPICKQLKLIKGS